MDIVEEAFDSTSADEVEAVCDEWGPADKLAAQRAVACVSKWKTLTWSRLRLAEHHVAPDTETLAVQFEAIRGTFAESFRPRGWLGAAGARKRGTRLRERWGGRFGAMRPREMLPAAERQEKVAGWSKDVYIGWCFANPWLRHLPLAVGCRVVVFRDQKWFRFLGAHMGGF